MQESTLAASEYALLRFFSFFACSLDDSLAFVRLAAPSQDLWRAARAGETIASKALEPPAARPAQATFLREE